MSKPKRDLCVVAREMATAAEEERKAKQLALQGKYVRKLVSAELFDQCHYNADTDSWIICGETFRCFIYPNQWTNAPEKKPCLARWNGSYGHYYIYSLTELGVCLKECDSMRGRQSAKMITAESSRPWWQKLSRWLGRDL